jgi:hypothetical protein
MFFQGRCERIDACLFVIILTDRIPGVKWLEPWKGLRKGTLAAMKKQTYHDAVVAYIPGTDIDLQKTRD